MLNVDCGRRGKAASEFEGLPGGDRGWRRMPQRRAKVWAQGKEFGRGDAAGTGMRKGGMHEGASAGGWLVWMVGRSCLLRHNMGACPVQDGGPTHREPPAVAEILTYPNVSRSARQTVHRDRDRSDEVVEYDGETLTMGFVMTSTSCGVG